METPIMARRPRSSQLENRTNRLKLAPRRKPYAPVTIARGIALAYRRNKKGNGTWVAINADGHGGRWQKRVAEADDFEAANGKTVCDFWRAQELARTLGRGGEDESKRPVSVSEAIDDYHRDVVRRGGLTGNAIRLRRHLSPALGAKPVALLTERDLENWRDRMEANGCTASTVARTAKAFKACLNLAARRDDRITNTSAWRKGLGNLADTYRVRNSGLPLDQVLAIVHACNDVDRALGLLVDAAAVTGARPVQLRRLEVADLQDRWQEGPRVQMPSSRKGKGVRRITRRPVPITPALAVRLRQAAGDRPPHAPLLLKSDGRPWREADHSIPFANAIANAGLDPSITLYALRHSSIIRQLLANTPTRIVAAHHDTSVNMLERVYSAHISDHADTLTRRTLPDTSQPVTADNVRPLRKG
jgi:integrase